MQCLLVSNLGVGNGAFMLWPHHSNSTTPGDSWWEGFTVPQVGKLLSDAEDSWSSWTTDKLVGADENGIQVVTAAIKVRAFHLHPLVGASTRIVKAYVASILVHEVGNLSNRRHEPSHVGAGGEGTDDVFVFSSFVLQNLFQEGKIQRASFLIGGNGHDVSNSLPPHQLVRVMFGVGNQNQGLTIATKRAFQIELPPIDERVHLRWHVNAQKGNQLGNGSGGTTPCEHQLIPLLVRIQ
mmetsp:Transcript_16976/g.37092  ORF Transcript_16976/g.37092 Transcript_16976/m.37092 type:complete len:238 (-) Transcript_16976:823-1536(-)